MLFGSSDALLLYMDSLTPSVTKQTISVEEAAAILGISRAKAYDCARTGEIPSLRFGRRIVVPVAALDRLLASAEDE